MVEASEISELISDLVDRSLVLYDEDTGRFRLLETVRAYSRQRLHESGESRDCQVRHCAQFVALAEEAQPHFRGPAQGVWYDRLELDHGNLRAALEFSIDSRRANASGSFSAGQPSDMALRLVAALNNFWLNRSYLAEGRRWLDEVLADANEGNPSEALGSALNGAGNLAYLQAELAVAEQFYLRSAAIWRALGDLPREAKSLCNLATLAQTRGDYESARRQFDKAMTIFEVANDEDSLTITLSCLANLTTEQGDPTQARVYVMEALSLARRTGNRILEANILGNLGSIESELGKDPEAREALEAALSLNDELGCKLDAGTNMLNLATLQSEFDPVARRKMLGEAARIFLELGAHRMTPALLDQWAFLEAAEGRTARAARLIGAARELRDSMGVPLQPKHVESHAERDEQLRNELTAEVFEREMALGRPLTPEQAIAFAMRGDIAP